MDQFSGRKHEWLSSEAKKVVVDDKTGEQLVSEFKYYPDWTYAEPTVFPGFSGDRGLLLPLGANYYAVSTALKEPISFGDRVFVLQYEVKLQEGLDCGGAYLKMFRAPIDGALRQFRPERVDDQTPFTIMFGPDRCGTTDKVAANLDMVYFRSILLCSI